MPKGLMTELIGIDWLLSGFSEVLSIPCLVWMLRLAQHADTTTNTPSPCSGALRERGAPSPHGA
jgi:hypothetical protein